MKFLTGLTPKQIFDRLFVVALFAIIAYTSLTDHVERPVLDPISEFTSAREEGFSGVELVPTAECQKSFDVVLDGTQKRQVLQAAANAELGHIRSSHSAPLLEAIMILTTPTKRLEYRASVPKLDADDLFLKRIVTVSRGGGKVVTYYYQEIRVPGQAKWIFKVAPDAAL
jgi:hypothetical protein